jgi:hypothetical protein
MRALRVLGLVVVALALPAGLAAAVYATSAGSLAATPPTVPVTAEPIAQPSPAARTTTDRDDRGSDRCGEAEHRDDPECVTGTTTDDGDSSGKGSGGSGGDSSGKGSGGSGGDSSGPGSGDD